MSFRILLSPPDTGELEQKFVLEAMASGWIAPVGPDLDAFESEIADYVGAVYAVGLSSGTSALHLALVSWGVGPGDVVIAPTMTFAATVNAIRYVGATPHLVDCDESGNIDPELLEQALTACEERGRRASAVVVVDLLGKAADYTRISRALEGRDVPLLCDAAEALGAEHAGVRCGQWGDASVLSFNGNKIMTTSGGGMLLTADRELAAHVRKLSTQAREPAVHYEHNEVGYNYRLSNLLAALGRAQLQRLDSMIARRRFWRQKYRLLTELDGVDILGGPDDREDNCWLTALTVDPSVAGFTASDVQARLALRHIESRPVWKPMHQQPVFAAAPATLNGTSDQLFATAVTLPSGSVMSEDQVDEVIDAIRGLQGR